MLFTLLQLLTNGCPAYRSTVTDRVIQTRRQKWKKSLAHSQRVVGDVFLPGGTAVDIQDSHQWPHQDQALCMSQSPFDPLDHSRVFYMFTVVTSAYPGIFSGVNEVWGMGTSQGGFEMVTDCSGQGVPCGDTVIGSWDQRDQGENNGLEEKATFKIF